MNYFVSIAFFTISVVVATHFLSVVWDLGKIFFEFHTGDASVYSKDDPLNSVLTDLGLICLFIGQHKLVGIFNSILKGTNIEPLNRTIFIFSTSITTKIMLYYWAPLPEHKVWDLTEVLPRWLFPSVGAVMLLLGILQLIMIDLPLFLGVKQTWYDLQNLADPMMYKTMGFQRYLSHSTHPALVLLLALWLRNVMSVDRFILACGLSAFATQKTIDYHDKAYVDRQTRVAALKWQ